MRGRRRRRGDALLPVSGGGRERRRRCSYYYYWEQRFFSLNDPLFRFGRAYSAPLSVWFSLGLAFSVASLLAVSFLLAWELAAFLRLLPTNHNPPTASYFLLLSGLDHHPPSLSLGDAAYLLFSTCVSISVHELGHAIAAASEGVSMEYIAVFVALLFPGALVAFDSEVMLALEDAAALRVYCAGIWHNAVFCAGCGLALLLLPSLLWPFFTHGESLMVLDVQSTSPLRGYLSAGDVIVSLDGKSINNEREWTEKISQIHAHALQSRGHLENLPEFPVLTTGKGYCVPQFQSHDSFQNYVSHNQSTCPNGLSEVNYISCFDSDKPRDVNLEDGYSATGESRQCLNATDVIKLNKCGDGWALETTNRTKCSCAEGFSCMSPILPPGLAWIEITYTSPFSAECLDIGKSSYKQIANSDFDLQDCGGTFVFIGEAMSIGNSVQLTGFQPRWPFPFVAYLPNVLEKMFTCTFNTSLAIALLNSLPVFFLDGESILEVTLRYLKFLSRRRRMKVLRACLVGGTLMSILAFARVFIDILG